MGLGKGGAEPGPATVEQVVRILEEYVGALPTTDLDEPHTVTFVRAWTLTRILGGTTSSAAVSAADAPSADAPSEGAPPAAPLSGGASLRVGGTVVRRYAAREERADEVDDQRTYEQLVGAAQALAARGFPSEEVYEGWRTVAIDLPVLAVPLPGPAGGEPAGGDQAGGEPIGKSGPAGKDSGKKTGKKAGKKRRLWRSTPVTA
ncbi:MULTISPECIES: hypothetical protein [unclassified Frankia]|uniref:hypothetical protein n=1 Tax=unclassified Frankia TaxID=2632575 RepID=UPI002024E5A2